MQRRAITDIRKADSPLWKIVPWLLMALVFYVFASHPTRKFCFDGVVFASIIEHGPYEKLFNPHHLLYSPLFNLIHDTIGDFYSGKVKALFLMQWGNIVAGTIGAGLIWKLLSRLAHDKWLALLVTLLGCFSFTYWHYSTDADVYIISTVFLLLAADRVEWIARHRDPKDSDFIYIGVMQALSVLFHQLNVFFAVCVAMSLLFNTIQGTMSERWRWWWIYAASLTIPAGLTYIVIGTFLLGHTSFSSFTYWITEYGHEESYWIHSWKEIPLGTLNGYLMVFFHRTSIEPGILDYSVTQAIEEGRAVKGIIKKVFGLYSLGFLFFCYLAALYNIKKYVIQYPKAAVILFSWLAPYVIFQIFFMPMNYFYKLFIFIPLLTIFAWYGTMVVTPEKKWFKYPLMAMFVGFTMVTERTLGIILGIFIVFFEIFRPYKNILYRYGLVILVGFLPVYNFIAGIQPESRLKNNPEVEYALSLESHFQTGDLLIFEGGYDYPDGWIISALTEARVVTLHDLYMMDTQQRYELLENAARVFVHPNVVEGGTVMEPGAEKAGVSVEEMMSVLNYFRFRDAFSVEGNIFREVVYIPEQ